MEREARNEKQFGAAAGGVKLTQYLKSPYTYVLDNFRAVTEAVEFSEVTYTPVQPPKPKLRIQHSYFMDNLE